MVERGTYSRSWRVDGSLSAAAWRVRKIQDVSLSLSMGRRVPTCDSCHMREVPDKRGHLHSRGSRAVGEKAVTSSTIGHCYKVRIDGLFQQVLPHKGHTLWCAIGVGTSEEP